MSGIPSRLDWAATVTRHARAAGVELPPETIDELAAHLEDLYQSAIDEGADHREAHREALAVLEAAGLGDLRHEPRPNPRLTYIRLADDTARGSSRRSTRSLAMLYALRMALRQFRLHPMFAIITVLVLGLGTGAAATVYTIVDTVVLRPLPYRAPDRLVALWDSNAEKGLPHEPFSPVTFMDYRGMQVFEDAAAWWRPDVNLVDPGLEPVRVKTIETSANLFRVLGVGPQVGPGFPDDGPLFSTELTAVISDRLWRTRYEAAPNIIGRQLRLNETPYTVVGVMPAGFGYPGDVDVWQRLRWDLTQHSRNAHFMEGVARLAPGVDLERARTEAVSLAARLGKDFAGSNAGWVYQIVPVLDDQLGYYRPALFVLFGAVGLLLLIGCLNVASLLLTRALAREREIAVRSALGASPRQLVTQLLAESLVLSVAGAAVGLLVATLALPIIMAVTPVEIPRLADATVSWRVLSFCLGLVAITTVIFGLIPALVLLRRQIATDLRSGDRSSSRGVRRLYHGLVAGEVALACALLVSSALLVRTVGRMTETPLGVEGPQVVLTSVQLSGATYQQWEAVADTHASILAALRQQPGVQLAGATNFLPLEAGWRNPFYMNEARPAQQTDAPQAQNHSVSDGYFEAMGADLLAGRFFSDRDTRTTDGVVIVNETFAKRHGAGRDVVGQHLTTYSFQIGPLGRNLMATVDAGGRRRLDALRIVGVVADVRNAALGQPVEPAIYFPASQFAFRSQSVAIVAADTPTAIAAMRTALGQAAPNTPLGTIQTWDDRLRARTAEPRLLMLTLSAFGLLAALLAALGVYGLFSWSVALRKRELAIRLTLGARPAGIAALVVRQSVLLVVVGLAVGWLIVRAAHSALSTVLFGVTPDDASSALAGAALLLVASLIASVPPALRAMRVDPVADLRSE